MAHFAEIDEFNKVSQVIVVSNDCCLDENGRECEEVGASFCKSLFNHSTRWVQTSYNHKIRHKFAAIGDYYDEQNDKFVPPRKFKTWVYDEAVRAWVPPTSKPTNIPDGFDVGLDNDGNYIFVPIPPEEPEQEPTT